MANQTWFYASEGRQLGPYPENELRELIAKGMVTADTLVWTDGMADWQKAAEIPGLLGDASGPRAVPQAGGLPTSAGVGGPLSIDLPLWGFFGRGLLVQIGYALVIPAPWTGTAFYRWMVSRTEVPGQPNLAFTGQPGDIWYVFVGTALMYYLGAIDDTLQLIAIPVSTLLFWILLRWIVSNLSSNGRRLPIAFTGSPFTFIGWQLLAYVSIITIIGWAWVITAWTRWICRNISGTRREVIFYGTGLEVLWRSIALVIGCVFLLPIPWVMRWYTRWYVSQFALVERAA